MTDAQVQKKLDTLIAIANELGREAVRRYGREATLFYECEGSFHIMDGDDNGSSLKRQAHIKMSSDGHCNMGCGAW